MPALSMRMQYERRWLATKSRSALVAGTGRWTMMMGVQSLVSLVTIGLIVARAVNILQ
jgi:hypothetical protein